MKRRIRKIVNFFAFNLLFFALYLNFIHKDQPASPGTSETAVHASVSISDKVSQTESYLTPASGGAKSASINSVPASIK